MWMSDLAKWGLFAFYVAWIDFRNPFIAIVQDPNQVKWWTDQGTDSKGPQWQKEWLEEQNKTVTQQMNDFYNDINQNNKVHKLCYGPFVLKAPHTIPGGTECPQIVGFYKCYFRWGGSSTGLKDICDPSSWAPPSNDTGTAGGNPIQY